MWRRWIVLLGCLGLGFAPQAWAESPIQLLRLHIPGLQQADRQGLYDQILQTVLADIPIDDQGTLPPARAQKIFTRCQRCCYSPLNTNPAFYQLRGPLRQTLPLNVAKIYIFSAPGQAPLRGLEALQGKRVGVRKGMDYGQRFEQAQLQTMAVRELTDHLHLLRKGRIDAFVAYAPDAYVMFKAQGLTPYPHAVDAPLAIHRDALVCRGVNPERLDLINQRLRQLREQGELKAILGDGYSPE